MFCEKCGAENKEYAKFCEKCGAPIQEPQAVGAIQLEKGAVRLHKKQIIAGSIALLAILTCVICYLVYSNSQKQAAYTGKLQSADKYLQALDYEHAEATYLEAIDIQPKKEEAYIKLADVYAVQGKQDKAIEILKTGKKKAGGKALELKLKKLNISPKVGSAQYQAYYDLCMEYQRKYGAPGHRKWGGEDIYDLIGLCAVKLMDFDGDGNEELLLGYADQASGIQYAYEVWAWQENKLVQVLEPTGSMYNNGEGAWIQTVVKDEKIYLRGYSYDEYIEQYLCMKDGKFTAEYQIECDFVSPTVKLNGKDVDTTVWHDLEDEFGWYAEGGLQYRDDQKGSINIPLGFVKESETNAVLEMTQNTLETLKERGTKKSTKDAEQRQAYYDLCMKYQEKYGRPGYKELGNEDENGIWESWDAIGLAGLCAVELIDFNNDGNQELVLGYESPADDRVVHQYEIWAWRNNALVNVLKARECSHDEDAVDWIETTIYDGKVYLVQDEAGMKYNYLSYDGETFKSEIELIDDYYDNEHKINGKLVSQEEVSAFNKKMNRRISAEDGWQNADVYFNENPKIVLPLRWLTEEMASQVLGESAETLQSLKN